MKKLNIRQFTAAPKQIEKIQIINAPIEEVWKTVADHQGMTQWVPMIKHVDLKKPNHKGEFGEGCERACQFGPDLLEEKIVFWNPPFGYAYMIDDMHLVKNHLGYIQLEAGLRGTKVTWTQYYNPVGNWIKKFMAKNIMMPSVMTRALKNLSKRLAA